MTARNVLNIVSTVIIGIMLLAIVFAPVLHIFGLIPYSPLHYLLAISFLAYVSFLIDVVKHFFTEEIMSPEEIFEMLDVDHNARQKFHQMNDTEQNEVLLAVANDIEQENTEEIEKTIMMYAENADMDE